MTIRRGSPESFDYFFNGCEERKKMKNQRQQGAQFSGDLGVFRATHESFDSRGAEILTDGSWKPRERKTSPDNDTFELMSAEEAMNHLSKQTGCDRMTASKALAAGLDGAPRPEKYSPGYYDSRDLADWIKRHGKKLAPKKKANGLDLKVEQA